MSLDSSELPPAGTQRATQPRPAGTCPIKQQIEQQASNSPPGTPISASQKPPEGQKML